MQYSLYDFVRIAGGQHAGKCGYVANIVLHPNGRSYYSVAVDPKTIKAIQLATVRFCADWSMIERSNVLNKFCIAQDVCESLLLRPEDHLERREIAILAHADHELWLAEPFEACQYRLQAYRESYVHKPFYVCDIPEERYLQNKRMAHYWQSVGIHPAMSTDIFCNRVQGYGRMDQMGYFEYPLHEV